MVKVDWIITELNVVGGAETFTTISAPLLVKNNVDVRVITLIPGGSYVDVLKNENIKVIELDTRSKFDAKVLFQIYKIWKSSPPDIIHTHLFHAGILGRIIARLSKIPIVLVHQHGEERTRWVIRTWVDYLTQSLVTYYIASCKHVANVLIKREKIQHQKIKVIYNGIDPLKYSQKNENSIIYNKKITSNQDFVLGCIARFVREKGHEFLLDSLALLRNYNLSPKVLLIGEGGYEGKLLEKIKSLQLENQVQILKTQSNISYWLSQMDIFILPSLWEGISLALLEAMASGLPVIATAVGGTPEVIIDHNSGLLVPAANPLAIANSVKQLIENPDFRKRLSINAMERVKRFFSIEKTIFDLTQLYNSLLN